MTRIRRLPALSLVCALSLLPATAPAQEPEIPEAEEDAPSLMERGARQFFQGLAEEMSPAMRDLQRMVEASGPALRSFLEEMGPALGGLFDKVKDFSVDEAPEVLPNGDILIRRKPENPAPDGVPEPPRGDDLPPINGDRTIDL